MLDLIDFSGKECFNSGLFRSFYLNKNQQINISQKIEIYDKIDFGRR